MVECRECEGPDADRHDECVGIRPWPSAGELVVDLLEDGRIALGDPSWHVGVPGPGGVADDDPRGALGRGGDPHGLVIVGVDDGDDGALGFDARDARCGGVVRHVDVRVHAEPGGGAGDRSTVIPVGGGGEREAAECCELVPEFRERGADGFATESLRQGAVGGPRRTDDLEGWQPVPLRFVLDEHAAEPELRSE